MRKPREGDLAIVTTESGRRFAAIYTLAPGIDYFWASVVPGTAPSMLVDPDVSFEILGNVISYED